MYVLGGLVVARYCVMYWVGWWLPGIVYVLGGLVAARYCGWVGGCQVLCYVLGGLVAARYCVIIVL